MVSPEPGFWIHAVSNSTSSWLLILKGRFKCIELAKTPRPLPTIKGKSKDKGKSGAKPADKGKDGENSAVYDYHDGSVHDLALRAQILRGYEEFKVCDDTAVHARD